MKTVYRYRKKVKSMVELIASVLKVVAASFGTINGIITLVNNTKKTNKK